MYRVGTFTFFLIAIFTCRVWARPWSYHYHPEPIASASPAETAAEVAPAVAQQRSTSYALKQAIVSDLVVGWENRRRFASATAPPDAKHLADLLKAFDTLNSGDDLQIFTTLSDYKFDSTAEAIYDCIALRKGSLLRPFLERSITEQSSDCEKELGERIKTTIKGSGLCATTAERIVRLKVLEVEIAAAKPCSTLNFHG